MPGFDKDLYMPERLKDENGKTYAYRDSAGNYYEYGFGLCFKKNLTAVFLYMSIESRLI